MDKNFVDAILRRSSLVKRWQILRTQRSQSIAEHQYLTAIISTVIMDEIDKGRMPLQISAGLRYRVVMHALLHDVGEIFTGDIPGPVELLIKPILKDTPQKKCLDKFLSVFDFYTELRGFAKTVVGLADILEAWYFLESEMTVEEINCTIRNSLERAFENRLKQAEQDFPKYFWENIRDFQNLLLSGDMTKCGAFYGI